MPSERLTLSSLRLQNGKSQQHRTQGHAHDGLMVFSVAEKQTTHELPGHPDFISQKRNSELSNAKSP
jgi:hypothetical protein